MLLVSNLDQLGEGLVDENERNEEREDLLSEAGNEANEDASLQGHGDENNENEPETDPHPAGQILDPIVFTKLQREKTAGQNIVESPSAVR